MYEEGTHVVVHSLGSNTPGEYRAIVRGIAGGYGKEYIYIVEMIDRFRGMDYPYSMATVLPVCMKQA